MWWTTAINTGLSFFGASRQRSAAREARKIGRMNARSERIETAERIRRQTRADEVTTGYARAVAAGSGFSQRAGTSQQRYISEMEREQRYQRDFEFQAGRRRADILERGGELAYRQGSADALSSVARGIGGLGDIWTQGQSVGWKLFPKG